MAGANDGRREAASAGPEFYAGLPAVERFLHLAEVERYRAVPDDTILFVGDVVGSTTAIDAGRYKEVNVAAAAIIAAINNALPGRAIAFSFGGDGASFVLPARLEAVGRDALAGVVRWAANELGLELRAAAVPVAAMRAAGVDLKLARFAVSPDLSYAMFAGGGLAWSEARMKNGAFAIRPAERTPPPDLSGLSCNFSSLPTRNGTILSLIVVPARRERVAEFSALASSLLALAADRGDDTRPLHAKNLRSRWSPRSFSIETKTRAARRGGRSLASILGTGARRAIANLSFSTGRRIAGFDPNAYLGELVRNTDFRKFDDGLRMTLDCDQDTADAIEALLERADAQGIAFFGTHRQSEAMLTCFVPSPRARDHVHFIDGAAGGYAYAAQAMKQRRGRASTAGGENGDAGGGEVAAAEERGSV